MNIHMRMHSQRLNDFRAKQLQTSWHISAVTPLPRADPVISYLTAGGSLKALHSQPEAHQYAQADTEQTFVPAL